MADHNQIVKEQLIHMLVGTILFLILAGIAVGLDLAAAYLVTLNVSNFTHSALEKTAHGMLVLDLLLFLTHLATSGYRLFMEMFK